MTSGSRFDNMRSARRSMLGIRSHSEYTVHIKMLIFCHFVGHLCLVIYLSNQCLWNISSPIFSSNSRSKIALKIVFFSPKHGFHSIWVKFKYFIENVWYKFWLVLIFKAPICMAAPITTQSFGYFHVRVEKMVRKTDILELSQFRPSKGVMHGWMWSNIDWGSLKIFYE